MVGRWIGAQREKRKGDNRKRFTYMRSIMITILLSGIVLIGASSCATMSKAPLASGEVRLLSMDVVGAGLEAYSSFAVNIFFEAARNPEITKVCFYEARRWWRYCSDVSDTSYFTLGTKKSSQVHLPGIDPGSHRVECHAEYVLDGQIRSTNVVFTQIIAHASPMTQ
jgi:hypothetical protein